jgi:hypothetical protein
MLRSNLHLQIEVDASDVGEFATEVLYGLCGQARPYPALLVRCAGQGTVLEKNTRLTNPHRHRDPEGERQNDGRSVPYGSMLAKVGS